MVLPEAHCESREPSPRKQWAATPSDSVLQMLANASLVSSDSMALTNQSITGYTHACMIAVAVFSKFKFGVSECISCCVPVSPGVSEEPKDSRQRRCWDKDPPERLLSLLEKARLSRAFSTFLINRGGLFISEYCFNNNNKALISPDCFLPWLHNG